MVWIARPPDEDGLANDMILRHKAPVARVSRVVTIVALHPVVVHLKGVLLGLLTIDEDLAIANLQIVGLIHLDRTLVDGDIIQCKLDGFALFGYPDRTIIIACPMLIAIQRIDLEVVGIGIQRHTLYDVLSGLKRSHSVLRQWHIA